MPGSARPRWTDARDGAELVPLVRVGGVKFIDGIRAERGADANTTRPAVAKAKTTQQIHDKKVAA